MQAAGAWELADAQVAGARARADAQAAGERARVDAARARRGVTGARGWACCWASRLCTRCPQPVLIRFDSVLFLSQFLDIVREPGS